MIHIGEEIILIENISKEKGLSELGYDKIVNGKKFEMYWYLDKSEESKKIAEGDAEYYIYKYCVSDTDKKWIKSDEFKSEYSNLLRGWGELIKTVEGIENAVEQALKNIMVIKMEEQREKMQQPNLAGETQENKELVAYLRGRM